MRWTEDMSKQFNEKMQRLIGDLKAWYTHPAVNIWARTVTRYTDDQPEGVFVSYNVLEASELKDVLRDAENSATDFSASDDRSHMTIRRDFEDGEYVIEEIEKIDKRR